MRQRKVHCVWINYVISMPKAEEPGVLVFRLLVVLYALCLPGYLYYRFAFTIEGAYQTLVCVLESYGALNVLLLGIIRFPRPWASAVLLS